MTAPLPHDTPVRIVRGRNAGRAGKIHRSHALLATGQFGYIVESENGYLIEVRYGNLVPTRPTARHAPLGAPRYDTEDLEFFADHYGQVPWFVHVAGPEEALLHLDDGPELAGITPHTRETAFAAAAAVNAVTTLLHTQLTDLNPYWPLARATVFHHGAPKDAPVEPNDAVKVIEPGSPHLGHAGIVGAYDPGFQPERPYLVEIGATSMWMPLAGLETLAPNPAAIGTAA